MAKLDNSTKIKLFIGFAILCIASMLVIFYLKRQSDNYRYIKTTGSEFLVYSPKNDYDGKYYKNIPYVNINTEVAESINQDIELFVSDYVDNGDAAISYEYDINGDVLSLVVKIVDNSVDYAPEIYFKSYNYNIKEENLISDLKLLELFGVSEIDVEEAITSTFQKYYEDLVEEGYYEENECDYECFLKYRDVENYMDDLSYFVDKGKLVAFKPFIYSSILGEQEYFQDSKFKFIITK